MSWGMIDLFVHYWSDLQSVNGFRCYNNRAEREMSASACKPTLSMPGSNFGQICDALITIKFGTEEHAIATVFRARFPADGFGYDI